MLGRARGGGETLAQRTRPVEHARPAPPVVHLAIRRSDRIISRVKGAAVPGAPLCLANLARMGRGRAMGGCLKSSLVHSVAWHSRAVPQLTSMRGRSAYSHFTQRSA